MSNVTKKAMVHGVPGEWTRVKGTIVSIWPLFLAVFCCGAFSASLITGRAKVLFAFLFLVSLVSLAFFLRKGVRRVENFFVGARREERVAALLAALPAPCHVFHDFVAGRCHLDHVVVSPGGVFVVETKNWRGNVTVEDRHILVDGRLPWRSPMAQASTSVTALNTELNKAGWDGSASAVICFDSSTFHSDPVSIDDVTVVNTADIVQWIESHTVALDEAELQRMVRLMGICS